MLALLALDRAGAEVDLRRARSPTARVVDHLTRRGERRKPPRNARVEAARIARGAVLPLAELGADAHRRADHPGRAGVGRDACPTTPRRASSARSHPDVARLLRALLRVAQADGLHRPGGAAGGARAGPGGRRAPHAGAEGGRRRQARGGHGRRRAPVRRRRRHRRPEGARLLDARLPGRGRAPAGRGARRSRSWCAPSVADARPRSPRPRRAARAPDRASTTSPGADATGRARGSA